MQKSKKIIFVMIFLVVSTIIVIPNLPTRLLRNIEISKENKMTEANNTRREQAIENQFSLFEIIDKNPGLIQYSLSKVMNWTTGKVAYYLNNLVIDEMIDFKIKIINSRVHKIYYGKSIKEFIKLNQMVDLMD